MSTTRRSVAEDLQETRPAAPISLSRAGVTRSAKAIRIRHNGSERLFQAEITCFCDLRADQKGAHMSRFEEVVNEAIDEVVIGEERIRIDPVPVDDRAAPERGESFRYSREGGGESARWPDALAALRDAPVPPGEATTSAPLGRAFGARSGDKGGNANVGVWARSDDAYVWLHRELTVERLRQLMPAETEGLEVLRYELPNLRALNFVIVGLLGRGVAASTRTDPQAKGLGEYLRAKVVELPTRLLDGIPAAPLDHLPPPPS